MNEWRSMNKIPSSAAIGCFDSLIDERMAGDEQDPDIAGHRGFGSGQIITTGECVAAIGDRNPAVDEKGLLIARRPRTRR
jgi:hypothetical protein